MQIANNHEHEHDEEKPVARKGMPRRQFLSYTLGGTTAFLAMGPVIPMLRFAVDPILQKKAGAAWVKVAKVSDITTVPKMVSFKVHQVDGWYESEADLNAWIAKDPNGKVYALSPICKHLGCGIGGWEADVKNEYVCPCHGARYDINGKNLSVSPLPLDEYSVKEEGDNIYLGQIVPNTRVK
jgi:menaquinol-cytochrome c reductase iron-sulfur subunit